MAITTQFLTGFEHGFFGTVAAAAGGGLLGGATTITGAGWSASTSGQRNGSYCAHLVAPASTANWFVVGPAAIADARVVERFGVKVSSRPSSGDSVLATSTMTGGTLSGFKLTVSSTGVLKLVSGSGAIVTGPTIDTTNWHLIELQINASANPWTVDWKVDGVLQTQATNSAAATTVASVALGNASQASAIGTQAAFTADYDDVIVGTWTVAATDWYGDGQVIAQLVGGEGTDATITSLSPGDAGTPYLSGANSAFTMVDDPPGTGGWTATRSTTDNIALRTATVGAYAEIVPVQLVRGGVANGVRALMSYSSSATQANLAACDVRNSAGAVTELWGLTGGVGKAYNVTANNFKGAIVTVPAAGWTAAEVNAIRFRFGGCVSADISPVPTVQAMMLEIDWPVITGIPANETVIDDFNRADGPIYAGVGANIWEVNGGSLTDDTTPTGATTASNQMALPGNPRIVRSKAQLQSDFDLLYDIAAVPATTNLTTFFALTGVGAAGYVGFYTAVVQNSQWDSWTISWRLPSGSQTLLVHAHSPRPVAGSTIWIARRGSTISVYHRISSGAPFNQILSATDARNYVPSAFVLDSPYAWKIDNLRGGPLNVGTTNNDSGTGTISASGSGTESYKTPVTYTDSGSGTITASGTAVESYKPPPPPGYAGVIVADNPIVYWRLGEAPGDDVAVDTSNSGNTGTYTTWNTPAIRGLPGALPNDVNTAVEFPATVTVPSNSWVYRRFKPCPAGTSRTFEWWQFRTFELEYQTVFAGGDNGPYLRFRGQIEFYPDYARNAIGLPGPPLNVWTHIAITFDDATTRTEVFYNGVSQGAAVLGNGFSDPSVQGDWTVGGRGASGSFGGLIDEFALYPGVLSQAQIQAHYDARVLVVAGPATVYDDSLSGTITAAGTGTESRSYDDSRTGTAVASGTGVESRTQTHFGVTASAYSFASTTDGKRKTFGVVARPATFAATTSATRKTFGVVARPATFAATTVASRKTFGVVARASSFGAVTDGRRKTFGIVALPTTFAATTSGAVRPRIYGAVSLTASFGAATDGRRKTFGVVALPTSFAAATSASRKTFGVVARPSSFTATTVGSRKTFGAIALPASFAATTDGRRRTFGVVARPSTFGSTITGSRRAFGIVARSSLFTATTAGRLSTFGAVSLPTSFAATTSATRRTFGALTLPASFQAATVGSRRTFGLVARPSLFTAVTVGQRKTFGVVALPASFAATTQGRRKTFGSVVMPTSFAASVAARKQTFGAIVFSLTAPIDVRGAGFTGPKTLFGVVALPVSLLRATQGVRRTFSQVAMPLTFSEVTQGRRKTFSQVAMPLSFTETTQGRRRTFGQVALPLSFTEVTQGRRSTFGRTALPLVLSEVTTGRRSTFSKTDMALVMTEVTQGRRVALGRIAMPLAFDKQTAGTRRAFGKTDLALLFEHDSVGYRTTFGQLEMPVTLGIWLTGFRGSNVGGTILNHADAVYLGDSVVVALYTGANQIWIPS